MSRRSRNQRDKRAEAFDLARIFGHGTAMPEQTDADDDAHEPEDWLDIPPASDRRVQIGPLDCRTPHTNESRA